MKQQTWFAVDGHGNEYAFAKRPWRNFPNLDLRVKWGQNWVSDPEPNMDARVKLPKGTIKLVVGRELTYADNPVLIEYEDYGNYTETRPEVLNPKPGNWPNI